MPLQVAASISAAATVRAAAAVGALGAGMLDLSKTKGTLANAAGPVVGTATGSILSGLLVQYLPAPTHLIYLILFLIFVLQALGVVLMPESSAPRPGALASLRPRFGLPVVTRRPLLLAAPALMAAWALAGLYGPLGPTLVRLVGSRRFPRRIWWGCAAHGTRVRRDRHGARRPRPAGPGRATGAVCSADQRASTRGGEPTRLSDLPGRLIGLLP